MQIDKTMDNRTPVGRFFALEANRIQHTHNCKDLVNNPFQFGFRPSKCFFVKVSEQSLNSTFWTNFREAGNHLFSGMRLRFLKLMSKPVAMRVSDAPDAVTTKVVGKDSIG